MSALNLSRYGMAWAFGSMVLMVYLLSQWGVEPQQVQSPATVHKPAQTARTNMERLLAKERRLDNDWLTQARQWSGDEPATESMAQTLQPGWYSLLDDVVVLQQHAVVVLQTAKIQKVRQMLLPYLVNPNIETSTLTKQLDEHLQSLLRLAPSGSDEPTLILDWTNLEQVTQEMDRIQALLVGFRRMSLVGTLPDNAKLSMRVFAQLSLTFPTARVTEFSSTAKRLMPRRWELLYQLEKLRRDEAPLAAIAVPPTSIIGGAWEVALAGMMGLILLVWAQHQTVKWQKRAQLEARTVQVLKGQLSEHSQTQTETFKSSAVTSEDLVLKLANELPDVRGRIKSVRLRFDSGQSLDTAAQDLTLIDDKLAQWDLALTGKPNAGHHHA